MTIEMEFVDAITVIASGLGIAAERVFGVFVGAQPMIGILNLISLLVALTSAYVVWKASRNTISSMFKDDDGDWERDDSWASAALMQIAVCGMVFVLLLATMDGIVTPSILQIVCPEYTASKEIIELVMQ